MVKTLGHRIMFLFHFIIITLLSPVIANVEKAIFTAPEAITIPLQKPSLEDLNLSVLTHDDSSIRANLTRVFPNEPKNYATGAATWLLLDSLNAGQRYELRVCWAAIQPTSFILDVYELDAVWDTPELIQSLANYAYSQQPVPGGNPDSQPQRQSSQGQKERTASLLLLQIRASADYFTDNAALMKDPPPVLVDLILDPFIYNIVPRSLIPTAGFIVAVSLVAIFAARYIASKLQSIAITSDSTEKKRN